MIAEKTTNLPAMPRNPELIAAARVLLTKPASSAAYRIARSTLARAFDICFECVSDAMMFVKSEVPSDASLDERADELVAACDMVSDDPPHEHA
jgi:hypothetical protein